MADCRCVILIFQGSVRWFESPCYMLFAVAVVHSTQSVTKCESFTARRHRSSLLNSRSNALTAINIT